MSSADRTWAVPPVVDAHGGVSGFFFTCFTPPRLSGAQPLYLSLLVFSLYAFNFGNLPRSFFFSRIDVSECPFSPCHCSEVQFQSLLFSSSFPPPPLGPPNTGQLSFFCDRSMHFSCGCPEARLPARVTTGFPLFLMIPKSRR